MFGVGCNKTWGLKIERKTSEPGGASNVEAGRAGARSFPENASPTIRTTDELNCQREVQKHLPGTSARFADWLRQSAAKIAAAPTLDALH
jgi:hypothetical protein